MKVAALALVVNLIFNVILIFPLKHAGLALSTSISSTVNAGLLWFLLIRGKIFSPSQQWLKTILQLLLANGVMAAVIYGLAGTLPQWLTWSILMRVSHLLEVIFAGVATYIILLGLMGIRVRHFRSPG